jgi:DMSO/TMAO reductase YedYZ molybdopterin-dependent catalytic subunit
MLNNFFRRKEEEQLLDQAGRLPPGQSLTNKFPVLHYGRVPHFDSSKWDFRVFGEVETPRQWSWEEFKGLPRTKLTLDLHCVTRWSKFDTVWEGVSVKTLVEAGLIQPKTTARYVLQHAEYGYTTNLPLEVVLQDNFLLATHFNGEPISPDHGHPLRGVVGAIPGRREVFTPYL